MNLYRELLGREPDAGGYSFWVNYTSTNGDRAAVARAFLSSPEYQTHFITTLYANLLNRLPDESGMAFFTSVLTANRDELQIVSAIAGSQEYFDRNGGSSTGFIDALYRDLLGRTADPQGAAGWISMADQGMDRGQIVMDFLMSSEGSNKLVDANFQALGQTTPNASPGTSQPGAYALAQITGNGYGNLFFQGQYSQSAVNTFLSQLADAEHNQKNDEDAIIALLASDPYFNNT